jgi:hypothetical protein
MLFSTRGASHRYNLNHSQIQLESLQRQYQQQRSFTLPHYLPLSTAVSTRSSAAGGYAYGQSQTNLQAQAQAQGWLYILEQEARFGSEALLRRHIHNNVPSRLHEHHPHPASVDSLLAGSGAASLAGHHGSSLSPHHAALTHTHPPCCIILRHLL